MDFIIAEHHLGGLGHRVRPGHLNLPDIVLHEQGILVLDHPEEKSLDEIQKISLGVLLVGPALNPCIFQFVDPQVEIGNAGSSEGWKVPSPRDERENDLIRPTGTDPPCSFQLRDKCPDQLGIFRC